MLGGVAAARLATFVHDRVVPAPPLPADAAAIASPVWAARAGGPGAAARRLAPRAGSRRRRERVGVAQRRSFGQHPIDMTSAFTAASALTRVSDTSFAAYIPDGWQQGRGAFGGLTLALLLRAMEACEPDRTRAARTIAGDLCGPVLPGPAEVAVRVLRRGGHQTNLAAELRQGGAVQATATAVLSHPRPQPPPPAPDAPPPSDWRALAPLPLDTARPAFAVHYDYRAAAAIPVGVAPGEARVDGWIVEREPLVTVDAPALVARLDAWWPTLFHLEGRPRPVATISFVAELLVDPATLVAAEPLRYRARMAALHDGFFVELRELWRGGRPVALNQQTFAILA